MRRLLQMAAGLGLFWLSLRAGALVPVPPATPAAADAGDDALPAKADPVASYTLQASLDTTKHTVTGTGTIVWRNASRAPAEEIWLHLYMNAFKGPGTYFLRFPGGGSFRGGGAPSDPGSITVTRLALGGVDLWPGADKTSPGDPDDETDIRVPLPAPVAPGAEIKLEVAFETHLPSLFFRTGYYGGFYLVGQWFPKLARREPDGRWAHFAFHHLSEFYADYGAYDVTVDTPADMVVGATGQLAGATSNGARMARRFVQDSVHDFAFSAWSQFQELYGDGDGVAIRVLYPPGYDRAAREQLAAAQRGLRYFGAAFGRYPYPTLTLVHPPEGADEAGGMEYPTLITTGGNWYLPWTGIHGVDGVTVHELGHQWFYGLVATDEHAWPFLDEGLNSYAEGLVQADHWGQGSGALLPFLSVSYPAVMRFGSADAARNAPVAQGAADFLSGRDYGALVYSRTATIFNTLGGVYGEEKVRHAIGQYTRRHRFQHPGPDDLLAAVREVVGDDAAAQLRVALFDRGTVDYAVDTFENPPTVEGGPRARALVRRRGALRFPVDVDLLGEDGSVERVRWDAVESAAWLTYHGKGQLVGAVIDPEHRVLLDDDLGNNALSERSSRLSLAVLDRLSFAAQVALTGLLP